MDQQTWKEQSPRAITILDRLPARPLPGHTLRFSAGGTLPPLVTAVNQGDFAALVTLTALTGGAGGSLIANQVQAWKDESDAELAGRSAGKG